MSASSPALQLEYMFNVFPDKVADRPPKVWARTRKRNSTQSPWKPSKRLEVCKGEKLGVLQG